MDLAYFLSEINQLEKVPRTGWLHMGIDDPPSVAEHSYQVAVLAYLIAKMEGEDPQKAASIALFHDLGEARIFDMHWIAQKYFDTDEAEEEAFRDIAERAEPIEEDINDYFDEYEERDSEIAKIVKDADHLTYAMTSKEYISQGYEKLEVYFDRSMELLKTDSAKKLGEQLRDMEPREPYRDVETKD
ncbi:MAG: HD family hydrolase [Candidatus Nanohaloarchaeota archaeon QJJ-9]|nr:HD family hydrolase [Candidatus Nanohaloarchaeota archaeon QJJ-9]